MLHHRNKASEPHHTLHASNNIKSLRVPALPVTDDIA